MRSHNEKSDTTAYQASMQQIFQFLIELESPDSVEAAKKTLSSLVEYLKTCKPEERAYFCKTSFEKHPVTPLMVIIRIASDVGLEPLEALLNGLDTQQRMTAYQVTTNDSGGSACSIAFTGFGVRTEKVVPILLEGMTDADIMSLLQGEIFIEGKATRLDYYLALLEKFDQEPLDQIAKRLGIRKQALIDAAYSTHLADDPMYGFNNLFSTRMQTSQSAHPIKPSDFSLETRKKLFLGAKPYLYLTLIENEYLYEKQNIRDELELWFDGFTPEQKYQALNPPGLATNAGNPILILACQRDRMDITKYFLDIGIPYSKRLQMEELDKLRSAFYSVDMNAINDFLKYRNAQQRFELLSMIITSGHDHGSVLFAKAVDAVNRNKSDASLLTRLLKDFTEEQQLHLLNSKTSASHYNDGQTILEYAIERGNSHPKILAALLENLPLGARERIQKKAADPIVHSSSKHGLTEKLRDFQFDDTELETIKKLEAQDMAQVDHIVTELINAKLFSKEVFFKIVLERLRTTVPIPEPKSAIKTSRHDSKAERSELRFNDQSVLYPDPGKNNRLSGGIGTVKPARDANDRSYAIKREKRPSQSTSLFELLMMAANPAKAPDDQNHFEKEAKNEAAYTKLLGRNSFWYTKKRKSGETKPYAAVEWVNGKALQDIDKAVLMQQSYDTRIRCIASGLNDLDTLQSLKNILCKRPSH